MKSNFDKFGIHKILNSFNKSKIKQKQKQFDLSLIKPRKIIIEYQLTNDCCIKKENKNMGHNNYMGVSFNPFNYSFNPKNRTSRNVYGALFIH